MQPANYTDAQTRYYFPLEIVPHQTLSSPLFASALVFETTAEMGTYD
jgi:hypothetical protein